MRADSTFSQRFPVWDDPALESIFKTPAHDGSSRLSAGSISGIVVGAAVAATLLGIFIAWRVLRRTRRTRLATTTTQTLSQQALRPSNRPQELNSENAPEPPPAYAKETPAHDQQYEMTNRLVGLERLHNKDSPEPWEQATYDNYTSPEVRSKEVTISGAPAEQESRQEWSHQTEMPYMITGRSDCSSGLMLSPNTTGIQSVNQP